MSLPRDWRPRVPPAPWERHCRFMIPAERRRIHVATDREEATPPGSARGSFPTMGSKTDWNPILKAELDAPYFRELSRFVAD